MLISGLVTLNNKSTVRLNHRIYASETHLQRTTKTKIKNNCSIASKGEAKKRHGGATSTPQKSTIPAQKRLKILVSLLVQPHFVNISCFNRILLLALPYCQPAYFIHNPNVMNHNFISFGLSFTGMHIEDFFC